MLNGIPHQQNESLLWENLPENAIIQLLIKNQEYLDNLDWNRKTVNR